MNDLKKFLENCGVSVIDRGPQVSKGWIGMNCPYCGDDSKHLGYNAKNNIFSCWRCGTKPLKKTLMLLTRLSCEEIKEELKSYYVTREKQDEVQSSRAPKFLELPREFERLSIKHKKYLRSRNYNWRELESVWGLLGASEGQYSGRIIIPIYFKKKLVSFTSRDITGKKSIKALTCPMEKEVIHAKHILHGFDLVQGDTVVVMEGPFDSFRYGPGSVNTQGIKFTDNQIELIGAFKNIFICFDSIINDYGKEQEKAAQDQAEKLADTLSISNNVWIINECKSDPGDMNEKQIKHIKYLIQGTLKKLKEKEKK